MHTEPEDNECRILEPNENDILLGRGGKNNQHTGNNKFRELAKQYTMQYCISTKKEKAALISKLVMKVHKMSPPGRFLRKIETKASWKIVPMYVAREKASQVIRDAIAKSEDEIYQQGTSSQNFCSYPSSPTGGAEQQRQKYTTSSSENRQKYYPFWGGSSIEGGKSEHTLFYGDFIGSERSFENFHDNNLCYIEPSTNRRGVDASTSSTIAGGTNSIAAVLSSCSPSQISLTRNPTRQDLNKGTATVFFPLLHRSMSGDEARSHHQNKTIFNPSSSFYDTIKEEPSSFHDDVAPLMVLHDEDRQNEDLAEISWSWSSTSSSSSSTTSDGRTSSTTKLKLQEAEDEAHQQVASSSYYYHGEILQQQQQHCRLHHRRNNYEIVKNNNLGTTRTSSSSPSSSTTNTLKKRWLMIAPLFSSMMNDTSRG